MSKIFDTGYGFETVLLVVLCVIFLNSIILMGIGGTNINNIDQDLHTGIKTELNVMSMNNEKSRNIYIIISSLITLFIIFISPLKTFKKENLLTFFVSILSLIFFVILNSFVIFVIEGKAFADGNISSSNVSRDIGIIIITVVNILLVLILSASIYRAKFTLPYSSPK